MSVRNFILFSAIISASTPALASDPEKKPVDDNKAIWSFQLENDYFAGQDNGYTNGARISWLSSEKTVPDWLENAANLIPFFEIDGNKRYGFSVGQSMYAPDDISDPHLIKNDRPYAGWLYGNANLISDTGDVLDNLQITIGVVGPASGAEATQKFVHRLIDYKEPKGWDHQLRNELGAVVTYEKKWRNLYQFSPFGLGVDFTPSVGGSVGNVFTQATTGAMVRIGQDLPADYGPPRIRPSLGGSDFFVPSNDFGWYLFGGIEGRAVARNIFLDGNTFSDSHSVDKKYLVGGAQVGIAFTYDDWRIAYTQVFNTKEFHGQDKPDQFGAVTASYRF